MNLVTRLWRGLWRGPGVQSGQPGSHAAPSAAPVNFDTAMSLSAIWAGTRLKAGTIAALPLVFYEDDGITPKTSGVLPELFDGMVNRYQTKVEFFETFVMNKTLFGNAYALKQKSGSRLVGLMPLMSGQVTPKLLDDGELVYEYHHAKGVTVYASESIWHSKSFGNGVIGLEMLGYARNSIGIGLAAENRVSRIYKNGGKPTGILTIDRTLKKEQREQIRKEFRNLQEGNEDTLMVLEADLQYSAISMSPSDIQLLDSRRFQIEDLARFLGVPSVLINDTSGSTVWGSGIAQIIMGWYKTDLRHELENLESSMEAHLVAKNDKTKVEFNMDELLRPDLAARREANQKAINSGQLTPNEARASEGDPPLPGGYQLMVNGNMIPVTMAGKQPRATKPEAE